MRRLLAFGAVLALAIGFGLAIVRPGTAGASPEPFTYSIWVDDAVCYGPGIYYFRGRYEAPTGVTNPTVSLFIWSTGDDPGTATQYACAVQPGAGSWTASGVGDTGQI